jgi:hypothetical protein
MRVPPQDNDITSFGAEALPGGLREINAERRGEPPPPARIAPAAQRAPLVGLIALVTHWLRRGGRRR